MRWTSLSWRITPKWSNVSTPEAPVKSLESLIPVSRTAIEERLLRYGEQLSPNRRRLLRSTLENPDETFFLSSRALARRFKVDPATIVRTIQALGYERYNDFAADLRAHFVARLTPYRILEATTREAGSAGDHVRHSLERDLGTLNRLLNATDPTAVLAAASRIHRARRILVVGADLAASLAWFLAYGLSPLGYDAEAPVGSGGHLHHKTRLLGRKDLLVAISFGRCLRATVEAAQLARERGVPTLAITDADTTPLARACDAALLAPIAGSNFTGSYVAPIALLNALILACTQLAPRRALAHLRQSEREYLSGERWYEPGRGEDENGHARRMRRSREPR
jgi:DNA-binding MurR/RpiR family transcriptional regulator